MFCHSSSLLKRTGTAIGTGLLAGLAGTAAISLSQMIEMKLSGRKPSATPAKAVSKVLDVQPVSPDKEAKVSEEVHWAYGTCWGIARGLLALAGLRSWKASLAHFGAVWGTAQIMLPSLKLAPPVTQEAPEAIGTDLLHHAVYAAATGIAFDLIHKRH